MNSESANAKAAAFLAALRGAPAERIGLPPAEDAVRPLLARIDELERRLAEMTKARDEAEEGTQDRSAPPQPPGELTLFLQARLDLVETRLQAAQDEALRATLLLREREEAQRKAQKEVEELFRSIREQGRASQWDAKLREEFSASRETIRELEARLRELQVRSMPVEEILPFLYKEEGRVELETRLREKLKNIATTKPSPAGREQGETVSASAATAEPTDSPEAATSALMMGRLADLERRLEEAQNERDQEKARRVIWEKDIMEAITKAPQEWRKAGGAQLVVEAALENLAQTFKQRDALSGETAELVARLRQEPPDSPELPALRTRLASMQDRLLDIQHTLEKHMPVVQAWLRQSKP